MPLRASVVVPTYNEEQTLPRCLEHLGLQSLPRDQFEVIVVDGGSRDRTREVAEGWGARVVAQRGEGIGGARNDGVEAARAPVVFTTDADVIVPPHWLERGLSYFGRPGVVAVVGPNRPIERERLRARLAFWLVEKVHAFSALIHVPGTPGNNTAFRRDAFQRIGGYRPLDYCDDVDMGFRLRHLGEIVYDREMAVLASTRRMEKDGYARTLWLWLSGEIRLLMGRGVRRKKYARKES